MDKPIRYITHDQCGDGPTVTFLAAERHRPLTGGKLYCLLSAAQGCD